MVQAGMIQFSTCLLLVIKLRFALVCSLLLAGLSTALQPAVALGQAPLQLIPDAAGGVVRILTCQRSVTLGIKQTCRTCLKIRR